MLKQSLSRNNMPKRLKLTHALQICIMLVICIWLLYQVKKSYDENVVLEQSSEPVLKLSRKDLKPQLEELFAEFKGHNDDEEFDHESEDSKVKDDKEDEELGVMDDEIDETDQEKNDEEETKQTEDPIDEEDGILAIYDEEVKGITNVH